jgi:hypothetical protein
MDLLYKGLKEDVKDKVYKEDRPETLNEYMAMIVRINNQQYDRRKQKAAKNPRQGSTWACKHAPNQGRPQANGNASWGTHSGPMEIGVLKKKEPHNRDLIYYNCRKTGHFARECRAPKKPFQ